MLDLAKVSAPMFEFKSPNGDLKSVDACEMQAKLDSAFAAVGKGPLSSEGQAIIRKEFDLPDLTAAHCVALMAAFGDFFQGLDSVKKILGPSRS